MNGFDKLVSTQLESEIRKKIGLNAVKKIEKRLIEKYGITLNESIEEFQKFDAVLREFFGAGADGLEKSFIQKICKLRSKSKINPDFTIEDSLIGKKILESFGDPDKSVILNCTIDKPKIIFDILKETKIPQTSGYRKINQLISDGLLSAESFVIQDDGKKVYRYRSIFENVKINIIKNQTTVQAQMHKTNFENSSILPIIFG